MRLLGTAQQSTGICPMTLESKVHVLGHRDPAPSSPTQVTRPRSSHFASTLQFMFWGLRKVLCRLSVLDGFPRDPEPPLIPWGNHYVASLFFFPTAAKDES